MGEKPLAHVLYEGFDDEAPEQIKDSNGEVCLALCKVCDGAECSLPTNCPGRKITFEEGELICNGELDF